MSGFFDTLKRDLGNLWNMGSNAMEGMVDRGGEFRNIDPNNYGFGDERTRQNIARMGGQDPNAFRGNQQGLISLLEAQAMGNGPGQELARLRAEEQADRGLKQQFAMAASAAPGNQGLASRQAMQNQGQISGQAAQAATQGGLMAQLGATNQLGGVLQGARGQDLQSLQTALNANQALEDQRANRFAAIQGSNKPTNDKMLLDLLKGGASVFGLGG